MLLPLTNALWIAACLAFVGSSGGLELISAASEDEQIESARSQIAVGAEDYVDLDPVRISYMSGTRNKCINIKSVGNVSKYFII
jgi:hypothetical protein